MMFQTRAAPGFQLLSSSASALVSDADITSSQFRLPSLGHRRAAALAPFASISTSFLRSLGSAGASDKERKESATGMDFPTELCDKHKPCPVLTGLGCVMGCTHSQHTSEVPCALMGAWAWACSCSQDLSSPLLPRPVKPLLSVRAKRILGLKNINVYAVSSPSSVALTPWVPTSHPPSQRPLSPLTCQQVGIYVDAPAAKKALHKYKTAGEGLAQNQQMYDGEED
jgi:hypothetical protein